jgi:hypothetical protein
MLLLQIPEGKILQKNYFRKEDLSQGDIDEQIKIRDIHEIAVMQQPIPSNWIQAIVIPFEKYLKDFTMSGYEMSLEGNTPKRPSDRILPCLRGEPLPDDFVSRFSWNNANVLGLDQEFLSALHGGNYPYVVNPNVPQHQQKTRPLTKSEVLENLVNIMETTPGLTREMRKPVYDSSGKLLYSPK